LQIDGKTRLGHRDETPPSVFGVEETANIELRGTKGNIDLQVIYRGIPADGERHIAGANSNDGMVRLYTERIKERLQCQNIKGDKSALANASYAVMSDDKENNQITVSYRAELVQPVQQFGGYSRFRYYYPFYDTAILTCSHKDARIGGFSAFPGRYTVHIKSRRLFMWWNHITRRSIAIDNKYFAFANKKRNGVLRATVETTFRPKTYGEVARGDLTWLRDDIGKIIDSNSGIGIVYFASAASWASAVWRVCIVIVRALIIVGICYYLYLLW
jgi:hypothetical protein